MVTQVKTLTVLSALIVKARISKTKPWLLSYNLKKIANTLCQADDIIVIRCLTLT
jgi:hypothetical protein